MANSPAEGAKDLLETASVGVFAATTGWGIFVAREPMTPDQAITIYDTGGLAPDPKWLLDYPSIQVRIRGSKGDYQGTFNKAKQCKDVLLGCPSLNLNGDRWVSITGLGDVISLGYDDNERPLFTTNFRLIIQPATSVDTKRQAL